MNKLIGFIMCMLHTPQVGIAVDVWQCNKLGKHEPAEALPSGMSCVFITSVRIRRRATSSIAFCGVAIEQCSEVTRTVPDVMLAGKLSTAAFGSMQEHFTYSWKG